MRKHLLVLGMAGLSILSVQAHAWGGFHGGGGFHAGAGGVTAWHGGGYGGGGWGGAYHADYGSVTHVGYGGVTHVDYGGAYHAGYGGGAYYHPAYSAGGCWGCTTGYSAGAVAAAGAVGLAAGAAIGSAAASADNSTVVVQQPVYVTGPAIGSEVVALPGGCNSVMANDVRYYNCSGSFYQPHFGSNGVYYTVVPSPF
ncbi:MAG: hypothetical protein MUC53_07615 [Candidatus Contendobacter sp.]|jgi:hypothetical protein|nr:hypothetical protein [Candidatus Contendobacter sp.]